MATHCLLVDDDAAIRALLQACLQQHGITVEALATGGALRRRLPAADVELLIRRPRRRRAARHAVAADGGECVGADIERLNAGNAAPARCRA